MKVSQERSKRMLNQHKSCRNHITIHGENLKLDADCEYCKIYFDEERILKRKIRHI
jgi:hypothetical protein